MKKICFVLILSVFLTAAFPICGFAAGVGIKVNDEVLTLEIPPVIEEGRVLVPLRGVLEKLDAEFEWNPELGKIKVIKKDKVIELTINSKEAFVNGKRVELDVPAKITGSRTLVPLRFIAENIDAQVKWDGANSLVSIKDFEYLNDNLKNNYPQLYELLTRSPELNKVEYDFAFNASGNIGNDLLNQWQSFEMALNMECLVNGMDFSNKGSLSLTMGEDASLSFPMEMIKKGEKIYLKTMGEWQVQEIDESMLQISDQNSAFYKQLFPAIYNNVKIEKQENVACGGENATKYTIGFDSSAFRDVFEAIINTQSFRMGGAGVYPEQVNAQDEFAELFSENNFVIRECEEELYVNSQNQVLKAVIKMDISLTTPEEAQKVNLVINGTANYKNYGKELEIIAPQID